MLKVFLARVEPVVTRSLSTKALFTLARFGNSAIGGCSERRRLWRSLMCHVEEMTRL